MRVFVVGGTGFIGRAVVDELVRAGHKVVALARDPDDLAGIAGVEVVRGNIAAPQTYRGRALGCQASVHLVGLLRGSRATYERVVVRGTKAWAQECQEAGVKHLVYVSAIGASPEGTKYQKSKWSAEQTVRNSGLAYTIFRPSFVIGPGGFLKQIHDLLRLRLMPVFGKQDYLAAPVARDDLIQAIVASLSKPAARNRIFHLGGPEDLPYIEIVKTIRDASGRRAWVFRLPRFAGYAMAYTLGWIPAFPATPDNLRMLFQGNVAPEHDWETVFGIRPKPLRIAAKDAVDRLRTH